MSSLLQKFKNREPFKVGVFFGGASSEKEISLESGRHVYNSLDKTRYEVYPIFIDSKLRLWLIPESLLWMNTTADIERELTNYGAKQISFDELKDYIDFAMLSSLHGKWVEDGCLQGALDIINMPYSGTDVLSAALGNDKYMQKQVFKANGVNVAKDFLINKKDWEQDKDKVIKQLQEELEFPIIVKPVREGCSTAVNKLNSVEELDKALKDVFKWDKTALAEEFIDGIEITCTVMGNNEVEALTPTQTPAKAEVLSLEEKFLPGDASMLTPPPDMSPEEVEKAKQEFVKAYRALGIKVYCRIDAFWTKDQKLVVLEVNTLPGVTPSTMVFHQAIEKGWSPTEFFDRVIELSLEKYEDA